jgi:4'-phosphopantetheinyl transferase
MKPNWPETTDPTDLARDAVHVWAVPLVNVRAPWPELQSMLSSDERARAGRFLRKESGRSFTAARAGLRSVLGRYLNMTPKEVPIVCEPNGKPRLADNAAAHDLRFNLAHSGELALVAVTRGGEIGVDVERLRPVDHWQDIASRYFHATELAAIGGADASQLPAAFLRCWTRKEAVLKAIGVGILFPLDAFRVPVTEEVRGWIDVPAHSSTAASRYWLQHVDPCAGYVAAVATTRQTHSPTGFTYRT